MNKNMHKYSIVLLSMVVHKYLLLSVFIISCMWSCQPNNDHVSELNTVDSLDQERTVTSTVPAFKSVDGQFSIQFPGVPETNESSTPTEIGLIDVTQYIYSADDKQVWIASFADYSSQMLQNGSETDMIDVIQLQVLQGMDATELSSRSFKYNDEHQAKTLSARSDKSNIDILYNIILVDNRIYQLGMFSSIGPFNNKDSVDFMGSFQLER